jgi:predicted PurR-regulated permease PerM
MAAPGEGRTAGRAEEPAPLPWQQAFPPIGYWVRVALVVVGIVVLLRMLAILGGVLVVLAASSVFAIGLQPAIAWFERRGTPRPVALAIILVAGLLAAAGAAFLVVPAVIQQVRALVDVLPEYIAGLERDSELFRSITERVGTLEGTGAGVPGGAVAALGGALATAFDLLLVLTLTPYFALALPRMKRWAVRLLRRDDREEVLRMLNRSTDLMANYIAGNLIVSVIAGVITFLGVSALGLPYAAALAVFVALTDLIPAVGATIGAAAVVAVAATQGLPQVLGALVLTITYQQVENFVIVPRVMRRAIDVGPATGIVALLVGATLAGPVGALLALPVTAMAQVVLEEFVLKDRIAAVRAADARAEQSGRPRWPRPRRAARLP